MSTKLTAIKVHQWLDLWDEYDYSEKFHRRKPEPHFYMFTLSAPQLKALSGVFRRTTKEKISGFSENIQRRHDDKRSTEINEYYKYGHPYAELSESKKKSGKYDTVRRPGWLPTALVVNILSKDDIRKNQRVDENDLIKINSSDDNKSAELILPESFKGIDWEPSQLHPIEVIDGQHRLWAFEGDENAINFELPVVAFFGLDLSWQAYLFWSINITPKKINPSLAYDLYPLLRSEDWLEIQDNYIVYRQARAQEMVEGLWGYEGSPWYQRINMLGEPGISSVSQSAFIQSLVATFFKNPAKSSGGLFIAPIDEKKMELLGWSGAQQLAFLVYAWDKLAQAINKSENVWASALRSGEKKYKKLTDPAFVGKFSLLRTDQGVRGFMHVVNEYCFLKNSELELESIFDDTDSSKATDYDAVSKSINEIQLSEPINNFIDELVNTLSSFDWRTSAEPSLTFDEQSIKAGFRGSGGYKMLRLHLIEHLKSNSELFAVIDIN